MKNFKFYILALSLIMVSCGGNRYITSAYPDLAPEHQAIAVLPFENVFTGRQSDKLNDEDLQIQLESEAYAFQLSLYHQIINQSRGSNGIQMKILDLKKTNKLLSEKYANYDEIMQATNEEICQALNVDAVVRVVVHKDQFFSTGEKLGIDLARDILSSNSIGIPLGVFGAGNKDNVQIYATIVDGPNEVAVWSLDEKCQITWSNDADQIVETINYKISRNFPYRKNM